MKNHHFPMVLAMVFPSLPGPHRQGLPPGASATHRPGAAALRVSVGVAGRGWAETQQLRWENDGKSRKVTRTNRRFSMEPPTRVDDYLFPCIWKKHHQWKVFHGKIHGNNGVLQKERLEVGWFFFTVKTHRTVQST